MRKIYISKRTIKRLVNIAFALFVIIVGSNELSNAQVSTSDDSTANLPAHVVSDAGQALSELAIKGRAPKTGYSRKLFYDTWAEVAPGCDTRNIVLARDMTEVIYLPNSCKVTTGMLLDPYTGVIIHFVRGASSSDDVQIDHVVPLSDAWQKGAQNWDAATRYAFSQDVLNLLAVDGITNQHKADGDAATWLPPNKAFRCDYVSRQIAVKKKYGLWITRSEYDAINTILSTCPGEKLPAL